MHIAGPDRRRYVLAQGRLAAYAREFGEEPEVLGAYRGSDLVGMRYLPPFPYFMDGDTGRNAYQVLPGGFVSTEDGTGIVEATLFHRVFMQCGGLVQGRGPGYALASNWKLDALDQEISRLKAESRR